MRVGIIEILALPSQGWTNTMYHSFMTKQFASVTPQTISVWCRQLGHETFYAIYYGVGDPHHKLPPDLDIIFISCYTQVSPIAYALAKLYRKAGIQTVIGGPHAKSFPVDCLRFFDLVVKECDKELIVDILAGHFEPGTFISSAKPFDDLPTVEERMPEIRASAFFQGKWHFSGTTVIPMLASMGCPYQCDFCTDWDNPYRLLSTDRLATDLHYITKNLSNTTMAFHDPNFGIKFDPVFDTLEAIPPTSRVQYAMECSLSILRESRMKRLKETNCVGSFNGIESWMDYSGKAGGGQKRGLEKVQQVVEHFQLLFEYVPYIQANFIFGLDTDIGDDPITLTRDFMDRTPFVWPSLSIPLPLGGTPLYKQHLANDRILKAMPFCFYLEPYLVFTLKNYDPITYFEKFIELSSFIFSNTLLKRRMKSTSNWKLKLVHRAQISKEKKENNGYRQILDMLRSNSQFYAFHEGQSSVLPEFYHTEYEKLLGPYAKLLSQSDRVPNLEQMNPVFSGKTAIGKY